MDRDRLLDKAQVVEATLEGRQIPGDKLDGASAAHAPLSYHFSL